MIYVEQSQLKDVVEELKDSKFIALDTETTGLRVSDKMFSLQLYDGKQGYFFNFNPEKDAENKLAPIILNRFKVIEALKPVFNSKKTSFFIHDAKFDLLMLEKDGCKIEADVICTMSLARILNNTAMSVSLENCCKEYDLEFKKNTQVKSYITKHKLQRKVYLKGKDRAIVEMQFNKVCHDLMFRYGIDDVKAGYELGRTLLTKLNTQNNTVPVANNERKLVRTVCRMQQTGIQVSMPYIKEASQYESERIERTKEKIGEVAGEKYESGPKWLQTVFEKKGLPFDRTPNGLIATDKRSLRGYDNEVTRELTKLRKYQKNLGTYYSSFEYWSNQNRADGTFSIHADARQSGTQTGRFSYREPNLQNVPKEEPDDYKFSVRKCFQPRKGFIFVPIDYDQQEYRMLLDRAGEMDLIKRIMEEGLDVHQATAELMGVSRKDAKTLNFGLLYGMGIHALAAALGVTVAEARKLKELYFSKLTYVKDWIYRAKWAAKQMNGVQNWYGRPLKNMHEFNYKMPNYLIQGGCGDVIKLAMNRIHAFLLEHNYRSRILLQVHDELLFEIHKEELEIIPLLKAIMEDAYIPKNDMKLTCSVSWSAVSWSLRDINEGIPTREFILAQQSKEGLR